MVLTMHMNGDQKGRARKLGCCSFGFCSARPFWQVMRSVRHKVKEIEQIKVKIFSVRADENFQAIRVGDKTRKFSANEFLEREIQKFLDDNPKS